MIKYIKFAVLASVSFLILIMLSFFNAYMNEQFSMEIFQYNQYVFAFWWIPYIFMIISGLFLAIAVSVKGNEKKDTFILAILNLIVGIGIAVFTVLTIKMVILGKTMFPVYWSKNGAMPSMILAGAYIMNAFKGLLHLSYIEKSEKK